MTYKRCLRNFVKELKFRGVSEQTYDRLMQVAINFVSQSGDKEEYDKRDVLKYINSKKASGTYKRFMFYALKSFFKANNWSWGFVKSDLPKIENPKRPYLTRELIIQLLKQASDPRDIALLRLASTKGLRRFEIVNLKKSDYKPPELHVKTAKHGEERILLLDSRTIKAINHYLSLRVDRCPYLFEHNSKQLSIGVLSHIFRQYADKLKLPKGFGWHSFRRGLVTYLLEKGMPETKIQKLLGWKTPMMVSIYSQLKPKKVQEEANRMINW